MNARLPRILYLLSAIAWALLLWPNPVIIFLAACFACLTLPIYRRLRVKSAKWRRRLYKKPVTGRMDHFFIYFSKIMPVSAYTVFAISIFMIPVGVLAALVSPQAVAGLAKLRELRENNFQLPPSWLEYFHSFRETLAEYPRIEKLVMDAQYNIDNLFSDLFSLLVNKSFGFVGSTMNVFWLVFLFLTLSVLMVVYSELLRKITCRILDVPGVLVRRYTVAIYRALKAIMLGIVLVACIQGFLCGIGFAVAGVSSPAFWGLLATMVAPIPFVGTALVWLPLCISLWFSQSTVAAVGLALWGALFVGGSDNILRPFFLRQGIRTSFFVLILSILCGLSVFGAVGLIAGPVLLAVAMQSYVEANRYYRPVE